jgi:hypothetical protein
LTGALFEAAERGQGLPIAKRFDITPVVRYYYRLHRGIDGKLSRPDLLWLFIAPTVIGGTAAGLDVRLTNLTPLLSATSLLIGVMLSLFVFVTNLRVKVFETESLSYRRDLQKLIASVAAAALYVALWAMLATVDLALSAAVQFDPLSGPLWRRLGVGIQFWILTHLTINIFSIIRRIFLIYHSMFQVDFSADLAPVQKTKDTKGEGSPSRKQAG